MTNTQIEAVQILRTCTFMPGSHAKRFVHQMAAMSDKENYALSERQSAYLWKLVYAYRKQHKNKWFTAHAENMAQPCNHIYFADRHKNENILVCGNCGNEAEVEPEVMP